MNDNFEFNYFSFVLFNLSTRWRSNEFIRGAYSFISTDCDNAKLSFSLLRRPLIFSDFFTNDELLTQNESDKKDNQSMPSNKKNEKMHKPTCDENGSNDSIELNQEKPIILFAGEACHEKYFSTAHGAFLSGVEQMEAILSIYN